MEDHFVIFLFHDGQARRVECPEIDAIKVFKLLPTQSAGLITDKKLQSVVLINGPRGVHYDAATVRWLCGCGPEPSGKDPNWMG